MKNLNSPIYVLKIAKFYQAVDMQQWLRG